MPCCPLKNPHPHQGDRDGAHHATHTQQGQACSAPCTRECYAIVLMHKHACAPTQLLHSRIMHPHTWHLTPTALGVGASAAHPRHMDNPGRGNAAEAPGCQTPGWRVGKIQLPDRLPR